METGRAGLQRKLKPNRVIYIDVTLAKQHGLRFLHCSNDVIMYPGDKSGFMSPFFFHEIRNKNTGDLIAFPKNLPPLVEVQSNDAVEEVELPPPAGATGFKRDNNINRQIRQEISGSTYPENKPEAISVELQNRLLSLYNIDSDSTKEKDYIRIAHEWNSSPVKPQSSAEDEVKHKVRTFKSLTRHKLESESNQTQRPEVFRIESGSPEHRDEFHSRWLNIGNIKDTKIRKCAFNLLTEEWQDILKQRQTLRQQTTDTNMIQTVKIPNMHNNNIGQEYVMQNGLKVLILQGDLVDETTEVIVNPAKSELNHGAGVARAILAAAGPILDKECRIHRNGFGDLKVGQVVHTTAGNLRPRIKYVLHAVGPHSGRANRQGCFKLVQSTILQCLEYTENILESKSLSIPAISSGLF